MSREFLKIKEKKNYEFRIHYIANTNSKDGLILKGTPIYIEPYRTECGNELKYSLFLIFRVGTKSKIQKNDVRHFNNEYELEKALEGVELILDIKYARLKIDELQQEINEIIKDYNL